MKWFATIFTLFFILVFAALAFDAGSRLASQQVGKITTAIEGATR